MTLDEALKESACLVEARLAELLPGPAQGAPEGLAAAMRHGVLSGGKRFRPFLVLHAAAIFGIAPGDALDTAAAFELLHCYSLIHDDLPAMDNDSLRRGLPTVHRVFGEAGAILAGDALQALAFEVLTGPRAHRDPAVRAALVNLLARAAGPLGMAGGQFLDMEAEKQSPAADAAPILRLQSMKTGALIAAAAEAGAVLAEAGPEARAALRLYGGKLGLVFQITDDILDVTGAAEEVGKATGKDAGKGKATFVSLFGLDQARKVAADALAEAIGALAPFGSRAALLAEAADFAARRAR